MITQPFTFKAQTLYGAYAPESFLCVYGACFGEAVNGLTDELREIAATAAKWADERSVRERS